MDEQETALEADMPEAKRDNLEMWSLVSDISQSLQISFASIKAAISSLLGGDIFWDQAIQHEFMQTIDKAVDDLSSLTAVMNVAMRFESHTITIRREPHSLQEILSQVKDQILKAHPHLIIDLSLPAETRLAFVDFEYLRMALRLLLEVLIYGRGHSTAPVSLRVVEEAAEWNIIVHGAFSGLSTGVIHWLGNQASLPETLRSEIKLKALVSQKLLTAQTVTMTTGDEVGHGTVLVLHVPFETTT